MTTPLDARTAPTAPFEPTRHHQRLAAFAGRWSGPTRTWLDPSAPPDESHTEATVETLLGGRFVRVDYQGTVQGKAHAGQLLLGFHKDADQYEMHQIDSFHTGTMMMSSVGIPRDDGAVDVLGSYAAGGQRWGWRTVLRLEGDDTLVIEAFNIEPSGQSERAIETRLTRR